MPDEEDKSNPQQNPDAVNHPLLDEESRALDDYQKADEAQKAERLDYLIGVILKRLNHPETEDLQLAYGRVLNELQGLGIDVTQPHIVGQVQNLLLSLDAGSTLIVEKANNPQEGADPITLFNGEFVHEVEDIRINGAGIDFVFQRIYRNQVTFNGRLGFNWDHTYNLWLRVSPDNITIFRNDGSSFREESYVKHRKFDQDGFNYYVPQDGQHGAIIKNGNNSFIWRSPAGDRYIYERDPRNDTGDFLFRIKRIQDKNGEIGDNDHSNYLDFIYSSNDNSSLLQFIKINNENRVVQFHYDEQDRIKTIEDYFTINGEHRKWHYAYDDFGDLVAVTTPKTDRYPYGLTTCYEYSSAQFSLIELQHNLTQINDPAGQMYLENEYGSDVGTLNFNRVTRQRQGKGETYFEYQDIIQEFDQEYSDIDRPAYQTNVTERNGHLVHYVYNIFGNLLLREEEVVLQNGLRKLIRWRYRYNADGALVGVLSPERTIIQYYYGREDYLRRKNISEQDLKDDPTKMLDELNLKERMSFGNLLAFVKRGGLRPSFQSLLSDSAAGVWGNFFPDIITFHNRDSSGNLLDIITKFTFEEDYQQLKTSSDPRFTESANPDDIGPPNESARYQETLTRYSYRGPNNNPNLLLDRIEYPNTHRPDGTLLTNINRRFIEYDSKGRPKETIDTKNIVTRFEYFDVSQGVKEGYLKSTTVDPGGLEIKTEHEVNNVGVITAVINPRGFRTAYDVNELNQAIRTVASHPFSYQTQFFYDRNSQLEKVERDIKDENGLPLSGGMEVKKYTYDEQNNLIKESVGGSDAASHLVTHHTYNESNKLTCTTRPEGNQTCITYNESLLVKTVTRGACSPEPSVVWSEYNGDDLKIESIDGRGNITSYKYDIFDRLIKTIDPLGNVSCIDYDKAGNIVVDRFFEKQSDGTFHLLTRSEYKYDELNRRIIEGRNLFRIPPSTNKTSEPETEFLNSPGPGTLIETLSFYDEKGRLEKSRNAKDQETRFEYDNNDRQTLITYSLSNDVKLSYVKLSYDPNGNLLRKDIHELVFNANTGDVLREDVFSTLYEYDELDRMKSMTDGLGNVTRFFYDSRNSLIRRLDPLNNVKRINHDVYGRKFEEITEMTSSGLGGGAHLGDIKTTFEHDRNNNIIAYIDANGNRTVQQFDQLDRKRSIVYADSTSHEFVYDPNDNIVINKDNNGLKQLYKFDAMNRMFSMDLDLSELVAGKTVDQASNFEEYRYDGLGRVKFQTNDYCQTQIKFDSLGRPFEEITRFTTPLAPVTESLTVQREFDELGNLSQITYPTGRTIHYHLDNFNRIRRIENVNKGSDYPGSANFPNNYDILTNEYRGLRRSKTTFGNGASISYLFDASGQIIQIVHSTTNINDFLIIQHLYDGAGNMRFKNDISQLRSKAEEYKYNSAYWLTKIEEEDVVKQFNPSDFEPPSIAQPPNLLNGQNQIDSIIGSLDQDILNSTYTYDQVGNRLKDMRPEEPATYVSNNLNEYITTDQDTLRYDLNGNLTVGSDNQYFYDYRNHLTRIGDLVTGQTLAKFFYDVQGRRILNLIGNQAIHFLFDGQTVIEELHDGSVFAQYVREYAIDEICQIAVKDASDVSGSEHWFHKDLVKSCRLLTDSSGRISGRYSYLPFGTTLEAAGPYNPIRFMSRYFDESIELYDFRTRTYIPMLGRFAQRDLIHASNLYMFVNNNPLTFIDPTGTEKEKSTLELEYSSILELVLPVPTDEASRWFLERHRWEVFESIVKKVPTRHMEPIELVGEEIFFAKELAPILAPTIYPRVFKYQSAWYHIEPPSSPLFGEYITSSSTISHWGIGLRDPPLREQLITAAIFALQSSGEIIFGILGASRAAAARAADQVAAEAAAEAAAEISNAINNLSRMRLYHGTTSNIASKIVQRGFRTPPSSVYFAEDFVTAEYFSINAAARTGARSRTVIEFTMSRGLHNRLGIRPGLIGEDALERFVQPGISPYEQILTNVEVFNKALAEGLITYRRLRVPWPR